MSALSYYQYIRVFLEDVESQDRLCTGGKSHCRQSRVNSLEISYSDDVRLYTVNTEELPILIAAASNIVKNSNKPSPSMYIPYTSVLGRS